MNEDPDRTGLVDPITAPPTVAERRNREVSERLRSTSRLLAMQNGSRRSFYTALGLQPRRRDRVFKFLFVAAFLVCFLAPFGAGLIYFTTYVSTQYEAETRFVLRSAQPILPSEGTPNDANLSSLKIVQDTLVLVNYLDSTAFVERIDQEIDLERLYARPEIDPLSRLETGETLEEKVKYFEGFIETEVSSVSGIVTIKVRAFAPQDAHDVLESAFSLAEERVNLLNREIWTTVLAAAEVNFESAFDQLREVRTRYGALQNETGLFDVELEAEALADVLTELRKELIDLQNRRNTLLREVDETHINVIRFDQAIAVRSEQILRLESELAGSEDTDTTLANNQQQFEALKVEVDIAKDRFKSAAIELEQAKLLSSIQMLYLDRFVAPNVPQDGAYPVLVWEITKLLVLCLLAWAAAALILSAIQQKMD